MISPDAFIHPLAAVEQGATIGGHSRIWQFCVIMPGAVVGTDCNICAHCLIEGKVRLGNRVTVKSGVYLWDEIMAEDDVFIGPAVAFTNDLRPRSRQHPGRFAATVLRQGCSLGANSTILPITIGCYAMVGAGAVVTRDVPDYALVTGNPARVRGWLCRCGTKLSFSSDGVSVCTCGRHFEQTGEFLIKEVRT